MTKDQTERDVPPSALERARVEVLRENPSDSWLAFEITPEEQVEAAISTVDLTEDPEHIIGRIKDKIKRGIENNLEIFGEHTEIRGSLIVPVEDNFDALGFKPGNKGRSSTYTRYVDDGNSVLRTHTSALVPSTFKSLYENTGGEFKDKVFTFPGLVFRRDVIDARHLSVFHQMDIWTIRKNRDRPPCTREDLLALVDLIFKEVLPGKSPIIYEAVHPYTMEGIEVYAEFNGQELEVLEAGLVHSEVLSGAGFDPKKYSGLALGMGIDRLAMSMKNLPDIRYLRAEFPAISAQMKDEKPFKKVSFMPGISRDMSFCIPAGTPEEDICEMITDAMGEKAPWVEEISVKSRTNFDSLHPKVVERLGAKEGQENLLVHIVLRHPDFTFTKQEANEVYDDIYPKVHQGDKGYLKSLYVDK